MDRFAYAGWNTDGNTLGTVIANSVLLSVYNQARENTFFNALRILEDNFYQVNIDMIIIGASEFLDNVIFR